jgi:hypothetical protein
MKLKIICATFGVMLGVFSSLAYAEPETQNSSQLTAADEARLRKIQEGMSSWSRADQLGKKGAPRTMISAGDCLHFQFTVEASNVCPSRAQCTDSVRDLHVCID